LDLPRAVDTLAELGVCYQGCPLLTRSCRPCAAQRDPWLLVGEALSESLILQRDFVISLVRV